jgi:hypothetical protein
LQNPIVLRRILIGGIIIGIAVVLLGIYKVVDATWRYDQLDAIPMQNLLDTAKEKPTNAESIVLLDKQKRDTLVQRSESLSVMGVGAVILGIFAFMFVRIPSSQEISLPNKSAQ